MKTIYTSKYSSDLGELTIAEFESKICLCDWSLRKMRLAIDNRIKSYFDAHYEEAETELINEAKLQLNEYFNKSRKIFDIPIILAGTTFQQSVWQELLNIPFGKSLSSSKLSEKMNKSLAIRAVAAANGANAISIFVPCHRVIGSNAELLGYAGGLQAKRKLLDLEDIAQNNQIPLFN